MKDKRGIWNITSALIQQLIVIAFGLILPKLFIVGYGSEMNGLLSSISQVYVYVSLIGGGIGTAALQALYRTTVSDDRQATNGVLAATHQIYKRTGAVYLSVVIVLAAVYPMVIDAEIPQLTIALIILFSGLESVLSFYCHGKYRVLLRAEGKNYILNNLSLITYILNSFLKIFLISRQCSIIVIQGLVMALTCWQAFFLWAYVRKKYSWVNIRVKPDFDAVSVRKSVVVHKVSNLVFSNTDVIILTAACGLKVVSVYSLYNSFFYMVKSLLFSFLEGVQYKLAQTFHADFATFKKMQDRFETVYMTLTFLLYSLLYLLIIPFMRIYTAGITDIQYIDRYLPILFTSVFLLQAARGPMQLVVEYARQYKETKQQAITEMGINLTVTLVSVYFLGIYGALLGTVAALVYRANAIILYVNKRILDRKPGVTYRRWGWNALVFLIVYAFGKTLSIPSDSYWSLIQATVPIFLTVIILYAFALRVFEPDTFGWMVSMIKKRILTWACKGQPDGQRQWQKRNIGK